MDIGRIFTRSLELMWQYKFLWIFALVMGLTSAGISGPNFSSQFNRSNNLFDFRVEPMLVVFAIIIGLVMALMWLGLIFYFRFVARGALVDTVRAAEQQMQPTLRAAWQSGRKFYARLLGLGLLINVPLALGSIILILLGLTPLLTQIIARRGFGGMAARDFMLYMLATLLPFGCVIACLIILGVVIHPIYEMAVRVIVLEDLPTRQGLRRGIERTRAQSGNVLVVYLLLIGARFGYGMLTALVMVPLSVFGIIGVLGIFRDNWNALLVIGLLALIPLWLFVGALEGIFQLFESNVWTEAYLAMNQKERDQATT